MEIQALQQSWSRYEEKLDEVLRINHQQATDIAQLKSHSLLGTMRPVKLFTLVAGVVWVLLLNTLLIAGFATFHPFFLVSMGIQSLFTTIAIFVYLYQLVLLQRTDFNKPIFAVQAKIARLQTSTLWVTRILFLQLPVWTTFYLNDTMIAQGSTGLWIFQIGVTFLFLVAALWLFVNIRIENKDKRWFRLLFQGKEWTPLMQAMSLLEEVDSLTREAQKS
ncbi:MAG: hypothetical protein GC205_07100 [Bacteroidetes bacterium]|nr:hypothetical protein [Bacteroidota bacterium]